LSEPSGPGIRLDSGIYEGCTVPLEYDPLLAKLAAWAPTRDGAIRRMGRALSEYSLSGVRTNIAFFREILADPQFLEGRLSTSFIERFLDRRPAVGTDLESEAAAALALALHSRAKEPMDRPASSRWIESGREALLR
jgi:acetyl-CoA carboxylase biotin carboxylase subunit